MSRQGEIDKVEKMLSVCNDRGVDAICDKRERMFMAEIIVDEGEMGTAARFTWRYPKIDTSVGYNGIKNQLTIQPIEYEEEGKRNG